MRRAISYYLWLPLPQDNSFSLACGCSPKGGCGGKRVEHCGGLEGCSRDWLLSHVIQVLRWLARSGCPEGSESKGEQEQLATASESPQGHRWAGTACGNWEKVPNLLLLSQKGEGAYVQCSGFSASFPREWYLSCLIWEASGEPGCFRSLEASGNKENRAACSYGSQEPAVPQTDTRWYKRLQGPENLFNWKIMYTALRVTHPPPPKVSEAFKIYTCAGWWSRPVYEAVHKAWKK